MFEIDKNIELKPVRKTGVSGKIAEFMMNNCVDGDSFILGPDDKPTRTIVQSMNARFRKQGVNIKVHSRRDGSNIRVWRKDINTETSEE